MTKNLLLALLFILASSTIATAKNDGPKIQGWTEKGEYKESTFKDDSIIFMKYSADGKKLFLVDKSGLFQEMNIATGEITREIKTGEENCLSADYDDNKDLLVLSSNIMSKGNEYTFGYYLSGYSTGLKKYKTVSTITSSSFVSWSNDKGAKIKIDAKNGLVYSMYYNFINVGYGAYTSGLVAVHNLEDGTITKTISDKYFDRMQISEDYKYIVLNKHIKGGDFSYPWSDYEELYVYDVENGLLQQVDTDKKNNEYINTISQDCRYMITSKQYSDSIYYRNIQDFNVDFKYDAPNCIPQAQSLNRKMLIVSYYSSKHLFSLYEYRNDVLIQSLEREPKSFTDQFWELSPDSSHIAIYGNDGRIRIFSPEMLNPHEKSWFITKDSIYHIGDECQFIDKSTDSPTGWAWDFGDGASSTEQNPKHAYQMTGTYNVRLITDYNTQKDTAYFKNSIRVIPALNPKFTSSVTSGLVPLEVNFSLTTDIPIASYKWDLGDGTLIENGTKPSTTKTYYKQGKFQPKVIFFDGYHTHEIALADSIDAVYPIPKDFDVLFEKDFFDQKGNSYIPCGFVALNGDLVFGRNTEVDLLFEPYNDFNPNSKKYYYPSEIYKYNSNSNFSVMQFNNELKNFIELPNGNYFLLGSFNTSFETDKIHYSGYYTSPYLYNKAKNEFKDLNNQRTGSVKNEFKPNILCVGSTKVYFSHINSGWLSFQPIGDSLRGYGTSFPGLKGIALDNNQKLFACSQKVKDSINLITFLNDSTILKTVKAKIDTGVSINRILYSGKYGVFIIGSRKINSIRNGAIYLYDTLGNQKWSYIKNSPDSTDFSSILHMGGANFAVAGNSGKTMGIEFVNADSLTVKFVELTGRTGVINAIDKTSDGKLFIVGTSIIYGKPKGIVKPGNEDGKSSNEKILMLENATDEYKGYAALLGVSKILGVDEESPRQTATKTNLLVSQSSDIASISYSLSHSTIVSLKLYDMLGRPVATIFEGDEVEGVCRHEFQTSAILPGIYLIRLESADGQSVAKIAVGK